MTAKIHAAVIGYPVSHSLSPAIFSFLASQFELDQFEYDKKEVKPEELQEFLRKIRNDKTYQGLNVTLPHKEQVLAHLDETSIAAQAIGAVNVIQKRGSRLIGQNTDVDGILATLTNHQRTLRKKKLMVLGAGGASRALAFVAGTQKAEEIYLLNQDLPKVQKLASEMTAHFPGSRFIPGCSTQLKATLQSVPLKSVDLLVNSTPLGMQGCPLSKEGIPAEPYFRDLFEALNPYLSENSACFDLIYRPEVTPFLGVAQEYGFMTIGGLEMLIEQALETWRHWFGPNPALEKIQPALLEYLRNRPIFISGPMGSGKSTIGPLLAKRLSRTFIDLDELIQMETKLSLKELFSQKGEAEFRKIEARLAQKIAFTPNTVMALGGGTLVHPGTQKLLQRSGTIVCLSAPAEVLLQRIHQSNQSHRFLLMGLTPEATLEKLIQLQKLRKDSYQNAHIKIPTEGQEPEVLVDLICTKIKTI
jgi:shikimate dehydrogenase